MPTKTMRSKDTARRRYKADPALVRAEAIGALALINDALARFVERHPGMPSACRPAGEDAITAVYRFMNALLAHPAERNAPRRR